MGGARDKVSKGEDQFVDGAGESSQTDQRHRP